MMTYKQSKKSEILHRIADALGTEAKNFLDEGGSLPASARETQELLCSFEGIKKVEDRRICLEFVNSVLARQEPNGNCT